MNFEGTKLAHSSVMPRTIITSKKISRVYTERKFQSIKYVPSEFSAISIQNWHEPENISRFGSQNKSLSPLKLN